jgi:hypothetical protein
VTIRVLVHGFIDSADAARAAHDAIDADPEVELAGWVARPRFRPYLRDSWFGADARVYDEPLPSGSWQVPLDVDPQLALDDRLVDENLRYLLDRERHFESQYDVTQWRSELVCYAQQILRDSAADAFLLADVPHSALSYAIYAIARQRGLPTLYFRSGPAPHLFGFSTHVGESLADFARAGTTTDGTSGLATKFVDRLGRTYDVAAPESMRKQFRTRTLTARATSVLRERPWELATSQGWRKARANVVRRSLRTSYERLTREGPLPERFAVLFLHLQPERSTVPEGGSWAQQWLIAHALASALPSDHRLLVREHPSTFLTGPRLVRNDETYAALLRIPNVELVSSEVNPFLLIDAARFVATVTGSVGLEAVARGKHTLVFGDATYLGCPGVLQVTSPDTVASAVARALDPPALAASAVISYLEEMERSSRIYTCVAHADDPHVALTSGDAYRGVVPRMLGFLQSSASDNSPSREPGKAPKTP